MINELMSNVLCGLIMHNKYANIFHYLHFREDVIMFYLKMLSLAHWYKLLIASAFKSHFTRINRNK